MKMDRDKYLIWYKLAKETVQDDTLIPARTDSEIKKKLVSENDWLMFLIGEFDDTKEAKNSDRPNVFLNIFNDDNKEYARIGITFNNVKAIDTLKNILSKYCHDQKEELTKRLLEIDGSWEITVSRKIKDKNWQQAPEYKEEFHANSNNIDDGIIDQVISWVNTIRQEGIEKRESSSTYYMETPSVNLIESTFPLNEEEFKKRIKDAFSILEVCLDVKSDRQIKNIEKEQDKELKELKIQAENLQNKVDKAESYISLGLATTEQVEEKKLELEKIKQRIRELETLNDE